MRPLLLLLPLPLSVLSLCRAAAPQQPVWPSPSNSSYGSTPLSLGPSFALICSPSSPGGCPDPLPAALARYASSVIFVGGPPVSAGPYSSLPSLSVSISSPSALAWNVDESYALTVPADGSPATLAAATQWGALRGLESFSQLVAWNNRTLSPAYALQYAPVSISDAPRWSWRSLLVDVSRHFLPVPTILAIVDGMAANKLNVLHLHATDDEAWPLASSSLPNLTMAAYAPEAVYDHADIELLVEYAWERGIVVVPEIDSPAHATAFAIGYPQLVLTCPGGQTLLSPVPASQPGELDAYAAIDALVGEFLPLFRSPGFFHLGGDEVETLQCWNESAAVQAFMRSQGLATVDEVRSYYESRIQAIVRAHGAVPMVWEEVFDKNYTILNGTVVDVWLSYEEVNAATAKGLPVVNSYGLYFNQQNPPGGAKYAFQQTWENFYLADPTVNQTLTPQQEALILGQSASMVSPREIRLELNTTTMSNAPTISETLPTHVRSPLHLSPHTPRPSPRSG
jgi:hexosaminidase